MVTQEHFNVVEEYVRIKREIKSLEAAAKLLQDEVMPVVRESGGKMDVNGVNLSIARRKNWTYPAQVEEIGEAYKQAKKDAETDGLATCTESEYLVAR